MAAVRRACYRIIHDIKMVTKICFGVPRDKRCTNPCIYGVGTSNNLWELMKKYYCSQILFHSKKIMFSTPCTYTGKKTFPDTGLYDILVMFIHGVRKSCCKN